MKKVRTNLPLDRADHAPAHRCSPGEGVRAGSPPISTLYSDIQHLNKSCCGCP
ncbi:MAG: hypothetical protein MI923_07115 [Phycisphaerales bacterium]|nr:hypothetical protein [Phycisphaerales bacterium]